ncbi:MAG: EAL domain-containing protein [Lachnospiraceae bacterium]|nr:EAL domain-containing protein [Lachnospiraceae bacterium]
MLETGFNYNFDFDIAAIVLLLFTMYHIIRKKGVGQNANNIYLMIVLAAFISAVGDIFSVVAAAAAPDNFALQDFWNYVFLGVHNSMPYLFLLYVLQLFSISLKYTKRQFVLIALPYLFVLLLLATNNFHRKVFYYDFLGMYEHGSLFVVLYAIAALYMVVAIILVFRHRKIFPLEKRMPLILFIVLGYAAVVVQMFYPYLLIELFFQSLGLLGMLFNIENKDDVINPVTGVFNRYAFVNRTTAFLGNANAVEIAVALPDIYYYNSTVGAVMTDMLMHEVAQWLSKRDRSLRCYDCGNGHFALCGVDVEEDVVERIKEEIFERFLQPWGDRDMQTFFPVRVCSMKIPEEVSTMENLLLITDLVFSGKESGELDVSQAIEKYERRISVERAIKDALLGRRFQVWYQPIIERTTGEVHSAEALVRLFDDELGFIPPDEFIPIAEQNGSILEIGRFVFEEVCRFSRDSFVKGVGIDYIEVNLSPVQCMSTELVNTFDEIIKKYELDAGQINLEITETAMMENKNQFMQNVSSLLNLGFNFSLDDYGTGYSNISYMFDMPLTIIKIDKSILWRAISPVDGTGAENARVVLENSIAMLKEMGYKTLVEGVETKGQLKELQRMGVDFFQGFFYSQAIPSDGFLNYVREVNI